MLKVVLKKSTSAKKLAKASNSEISKIGKTIEILAQLDKHKFKREKTDKLENSANKKKIKKKDKGDIFATLIRIASLNRVIPKEETAFS